MTARSGLIPNLVLLCCLLVPVYAQGVTVFAAASLGDAINNAVTLYARKSGEVVRTSYAASSALARQIENGAPADLYFSADEQWMDYLDQRHLIETGSRVSRLGNRLVLVAPVGAAPAVAIRQGLDLAGLLGRGRLATGDPSSVPAGRYAQQALIWLGAWKAVEAKLARADNVRVALAYVERGEVPFAIVYSTDAMVSRGVKVVGTFPSESHAPISYPLAIVAGRANDASKAFHAFLLGGEAAAVFDHFGFSVK